MDLVKLLIVGWSAVLSASLICFGMLKAFDASLIFRMGSVSELGNVFYLLAPLYIFGVWFFGCILIVATASGTKALIPVLREKLKVPFWVSERGNALDQKKKIVINCFHCGMSLRIPTPATPIIVTCPHCHKKFRSSVETCAFEQQSDGGKETP